MWAKQISWLRWGELVEEMRFTMGGSLPLFLFEKYLNAKTVTISIANDDNNEHAENENSRMGNLFNGIEKMGLLMMLK